MSKVYIGYARVSTEEQNEARQLESFRSFSEPISKTFIDKCSGKNMNRPQLKRLYGSSCFLMASATEKMTGAIQEHLISFFLSIGLLSLSMDASGMDMMAASIT